MKRPPDYLQIGTKIYEIRPDDLILHEDGDAGCCTGASCLIRFAPAQSPQQVPDTLLHEALHACIYESALHPYLRSLDDKGELEEIVVRQLGAQLLDLIRRNPKFIRWLQLTEQKPTS